MIPAIFLGTDEAQKEYENSKKVNQQVRVIKFIKN